MQSRARCPWIARVRDHPHFRQGHSVSADPVPPGLAVIELHGLTCTQVDSAPGQFAGIVKDLTAILARDYDLIPLADDIDGAPLLSACVVGRRSRDGPCGPLTKDDACALLCVAALPAGSDSVWMAFDLAPCDRTGCRRLRAPHAHVKAVDAFLTEAAFHGCFAQHATISSDGVIARNSDDARDCASCASTWRGHRVLSRKSLGRGACGRVCLMAARPSLFDDITLADIAMCGVQAIADARFRGDDQWAVAHATQTLGNLLVLIEDIINACTRAKDHGVPRALSAVAELDGSAGRILGNGLHGFTDTDRTLPPMAAALVLACSVARQIKADVSRIILDDTGTDITGLEVSASFMGEWRMPRLAIKRTDDVLALTDRMASFLSALRDQRAAAVAITTDPVMLAIEPAPGRQQRQAPPDPKPTPAVGSTACLASDTPRCAGAGCRAPSRHITSGCVVTARCTAGCRATFHRACWKVAGIARADQTPCPTPDCWGKLAEVTSVRSRAPDCKPRVLWRARKTCDLPSPVASLSALPLSPARPNTKTDGDDDRADDGGAPARGDTTCRDGRGTVDGEDCCVIECAGQDDVASEPPCAPLASLATGGTPYCKVDTSHEGGPKRRKRRRARPGKPQRCRLARQESDRLLALAGLVDADGVRPKDTPTSSGAYADDALWPPFFVADIV
ncbi:hypothetical protein pdul_cds_1025 [Pandoravirus dulcis]|uniref:Uncharacterized protein n=1 Tax=Pandoravirus dulcis TaxID=1349409 RepID=S4VSL4_9VIRU|nr:hypothetical protein pdul_cds_1025 [Pandoravirus dulcis]AGO83297.1 hypothetical protein pdul_cds_1025 [Pandoravirus dulcis]